MRRSPARSRRLTMLVSLAVAAAPVTAAAQVPGLPEVVAHPVTPASTPAPTPAPAHDPSALAAIENARDLMRAGDYSEAVARLDLAIDLEPNWSAPVHLRAEAFGKLAERYKPSAAFLSAQASDLERLILLEPHVDVAARQQQVAVLRKQAREARELEQKRRKLVKPAILVITASAVMMVSGGLMLGFIPSTTPDAYAQQRYIYAGAAMLGVGVALAVPAITLGVLAGRQGRRDSTLAEFNVRTDRPHADLALAPQSVPGGGGMALRLRF